MVDLWSAVVETLILLLLLFWFVCERRDRRHDRD